jgi:hypothetical protein
MLGRAIQPSWLGKETLVRVRNIRQTSGDHLASVKMCVLDPKGIRAVVKSGRCWINGLGLR